MPASTSSQFNFSRFSCMRFQSSALVCLLSLLALVSSPAGAAESEGQITNPANPAPAYTSVQENLKAMDQDGDGQVSVLELRAYLETRHGKGYEQKVMDDLELSAKGRSCATPFAQSFY